MIASNNMYNLQKYSFVLLVLTLHIKHLVSLPLEGQVNPVAASQPINSGVAARSGNLSDNNPVARSLDNSQSSNVSNSNPSVRIADTVASANISADPSPVVSRIQPETVVNPVGNIATRSAFDINLQNAPPAALNPQQATLNASGEAPVLRSAFTDVSNKSEIQQRSLNVSSSNVQPEIVPAPANVSQPDTRSAPKVESAAAPVAPANNSFIPSFLKSFGLRKKRDEEANASVSENNAPAARMLPVAVGNASESISARNNFGHAANPAPITPELNANQNHSPSNIDVRSNVGVVENANPGSNSGIVPQANVNAEQPSPAIVRQPESPVNLEPAASSAVFIPYINVYPLESLQ